MSADVLENGMIRDAHYGDRSCMQEDIVEECRKHGIIVTAYSPLGSDGAPLLQDPVVQKLAEKYSVSPSNILISLQVNRPGVTGEHVCTSMGQVT